MEGKWVNKIIWNDFKIDMQRYEKSAIYKERVKEVYRPSYLLAQLTTGYFSLCFFKALCKFSNNLHFP